MTSRMTIVRLPPQDKPVYFAVNMDWDEYATEERQCPSDLFLSGCELVAIDGDLDPHGLFEWVRTIDRPAFLATGYSDDDWLKIVPEVAAGATVAETK